MPAALSGREVVDEVVDMEVEVEVRLVEERMTPQAGLRQNSGREEARQGEARQGARGIGQIRNRLQDQKRLLPNPWATESRHAFHVFYRL